MSLILGENPTRKKIIMLLKKSEHLTVAEMSKEMGITTMAVRQHLMSLEKRGFISYISQKAGIGRPVFLYSLTEKAIDHFPKGYGDLARDLLETIARLDGSDKIARLFGERNNKLLKSMQPSIDMSAPLEGRVRSLADLLNDRGCMADVSVQGDSIEIRLYNCLLRSVVSQYKEPCEHEQALFSQLLDAEVSCTQCQRDGGPSCRYIINTK